MSAPMQIVPLYEHHIQGAIEFLKKHYGEQYYGANETYFNWLYVRSACGWFEPLRLDGRIPANGVLGSEGELLALHTYLPFDGVLHGSSFKGLFDEEWINGSNIRGVGRALATVLLGETELYAGLGCNELSEAAFKKLGFDFQLEVPRLVAVLDQKALSELISRTDQGAHAVFDEVVCDAAWHELPDADSLPDEIFGDYRKSQTFAVDRSVGWCAWRYDGHPFIEYRYISSSKDGNEGVAVVRLEKILGTKYQNARVVDLLGDVANCGRMFAAAVSFAQSTECLIADFTTTSPAFAARLAARSLEAGVSVIRNPRIPYMFQPCAFGAATNVNMVLAGEILNIVGAPPDFHATKADSTQDILRNLESGPKLRTR